MVGTWGALERQYLHHWLDWSTLARTWEVLEYHLLRHTCAPLPQYLRTIERPNSRKHLILHTSESLTLLGSKQDQIQPDSKMHLTAQCGNWIFSFCLIASLFVFTSRFANFVQGKWSNHDSKNCSEIRTVMWSVIWLKCILTEMYPSFGLIMWQNWRSPPPCFAKKNCRKHLLEKTGHS